MFGFMWKIFLCLPGMINTDLQILAGNADIFLMFLFTILAIAKYRIRDTSLI